MSLSKEAEADDKLGCEGVRLQGLHIEYDACREIRLRFKENFSIVRETNGAAFVSASLKNMVLNSSVLMPVLEEMKIFGDLEFASIDEVKAALRKFYRAELPDESKWKQLETNIHGDATTIKRLLSGVKRKWSKPETPKDPCVSS